MTSRLPVVARLNSKYILYSQQQNPVMFKQMFEHEVFQMNCPVFAKYFSAITFLETKLYFVS